MIHKMLLGMLYPLSPTLFLSLSHRQQAQHQTALVKKLLLFGASEPVFKMLFQKDIFIFHSTKSRVCNYDK